MLLLTETISLTNNKIRSILHDAEKALQPLTFIM